MARILFCPWPLSGQSLAMVALAKRLRRAGHTVLVTGIPDVAAFAEPEGLPFAPVMRNELPRGWVLGERERLGAVSGPRRWARHLSAVRGAAALLHDVAAGGASDLEPVLASLEPDLAIVSSSSVFPTFFALAAHRLGVPSAYLTTIPWHRESDSIPPPVSPLIPDGTDASRERIREAWSSFFARKRLRRRLTSLVTAIDVETAVRRYAARCGFPGEELEMRSFLSPLMRIPELLAFPRELELDGAPRDPAREVGALVDPERAEAAVRPAADSSRPLVYCTLGTLPYLTPRAIGRFVRNVVETFSRRTDCDLVVNLAGQASPAWFAAPPRHVVVASSAPQLELLRRATLVISHAGCNTIKESLFFGVPVIAFPLGFDHEGVAARVTAAGVGMRGDIGDCAPRRLAPLVDRGLGDDRLRGKAKELGAAIRKSDDDSRSIAAVESLLRKESALAHVRHRRVS